MTGFTGFTDIIMLNLMKEILRDLLFYFTKINSDF